MSIDNTPVLFIGLPATEKNFPGLTSFADVDDYIQSVRGDDKDLRYYDTPKYHDPERLIGYALGDSESHTVLLEYEARFQQHFGADAENYLLKY